MPFCGISTWGHGYPLVATILPFLDHALGTRPQNSLIKLPEPIWRKNSGHFSRPWTMWIPLVSRGSWRVAVWGSSRVRCVWWFLQSCARDPSWCSVESGADGKGTASGVSFYIQEDVKNSLPGSDRVGWSAEAKMIKRPQYRTRQVSLSSLGDVYMSFSLELSVSNSLLCWKQILTLVFVFSNSSTLLHSIFPKKFQIKKSFFLRRIIELYY